MEGRSELALLAYAKLQLSFAAAAAAFTAAAAREGEKKKWEMVAAGQLHLSLSRLGHVCSSEEQ